MSKLYNVLYLVTALVFTGHVFASENPLVEKKKVYTKSYSLSGSDKVSLTNKFGAIKINTWSQNEVKVEVTIRAEARTDERAQAILDKISISDGKSGDGVYFKTSISGGGNNNNNKWDKGEKQGFQVDYEVYMPARNPISVSNEFGGITIGDHSGEATLISKFGSIDAGKLSNAKKVQIEFGTLKLDGIHNGDLIVKFSAAEIKKLSGDLDVVLEHSGGVKLVVDNDLKKIDIKSSFTPFIFDMASNFNATFDIRTSFAKLNNKSNFTISKEGNEDRGPKFDFDYNGKSGNGANSVKIKTSFGDITFGHNMPFNINEKKKNKPKEI